MSGEKIVIKPIKSRINRRSDQRRNRIFKNDDFNTIEMIDFENKSSLTVSSHKVDKKPGN